MKKIVGIIRPFGITQPIFVYEEGVQIEEVTTTLDDFNNTIFALVDKYDITEVDLAGAKQFNSKIKQELGQEELTRYTDHKININLI